MKKIFCILAVILLLHAACACAEEHLSIRLVFPGCQDRNVTADLYEQDGELITVSTLFPEYAAAADARRLLPLSDAGRLLSMDPDSVIQLWETADSLLMAWIEPYLSLPEKGIYAGSLFDHASAVRECTCSFSDFPSFVLRNREDIYGDILSKVTEKAGMFSGGRISLHIRSFDNGRYLNMHVIENGNVIMVISADRSQGHSSHILVSFREQEKYYFREYILWHEPGTVTVQTSLRSGYGSSFSSVAGDTPLYAGTFCISEGTEQSVDYSWILESETLRQPLVITGSTKQDNGAVRSEAAVYIGEPETEQARISFCIEPVREKLSPEGKQVIKTEYPEKSDALSLSAASNMVLLAAELLPSLPVEYQELVLKLINP